MKCLSTIKILRYITTLQLTELINAILVLAMWEWLLVTPVKLISTILF
jgi:hypothetical protein